MVSSSEDWPWSSYGVTAGMRPHESFPQSEWLLGLFSPSKVQAQRLYTDFVKDGVDRESPLKKARVGLILGRGSFVEKSHKLIEALEKGEALRRGKYAARLSLAEKFEGRERNERIHDAVYRWGYTLKDAGNHVGLHYSRDSKIAARVAKSKT